MLDSRENYKFDLGVEGSRETDECPFKSTRLKKLLALHITGTKTKNAFSLSWGVRGWGGGAGIRKEFYKMSLMFY